MMASGSFTFRFQLGKETFRAEAIERHGAGVQSPLPPMIGGKFHAEAQSPQRNLLCELCASAWNSFQIVEVLNEKLPGKDSNLE
jgi:hypothetical protein